MMENLLILLLPALVSGLICSIIASQKGRDGFGWFCVGVFFLPVAIPLLLIASPVREKLEPMKSCQHCKERVHAAAMKCPYCQSSLEVLKEAHKVTAQPEGAAPEDNQKVLTAKDRVIAQAEELGYTVEVSDSSNMIALIKDGKRKEFLILKRAQDFLSEQ